MALFGSSRDMSLFRKINRELLGNIVSQQCAFYKISLERTNVNIYGEAPEEKYYTSPIILDCLIQRDTPETVNTEIGLDFFKNRTFKFLRDDFLSKDKEFNFNTRYGVELYPEVGDIILYQERYYEIDTISVNQLFTGKDPDYTNQPNPLSTNLQDFGYNLSVICKTHYVSSDKVGITKERII